MYDDSEDWIPGESNSIFYVVERWNPRFRVWAETNEVKYSTRDDADDYMMFYHETYGDKCRIVMLTREYDVVSLVEK